MDEKKNRIVITLTDGTWYTDGSGKTYAEWFHLMMWKTPCTIDLIKENGTHVCFHSDMIHHIEEKKYNE